MAKITTLDQALKVIRQLREENDALRIRAVGVRSDGTLDRYTDMESAELRALVIKRSGDPDEIVQGLHSRQRSIRLRQWLREHPAKGEKTAKAVTKKTVKAPTPAPVVKKRKPPVAEVPVKKARAKVVEAPAKKKRTTGRSM